MDRRVSYELNGGIATIAMDDGKVNALSNDMFAELNEALDRAEADDAIVLLTGREGILSAGFDLKTLQGGGEESVAMFMSGFRLSRRMLSFPKPVVIACGGHAMAMGLFVLLSGDYRVGAAGDFKLVANEVAIGITMPHSAIEICRQRVAPAHLSRVVNLAEQYTPDQAIEAGLVDEVVPAGDVIARARAVAEGYASLDLGAHARTKQRLRADAFAALDAAMERDEAEFRAFL